MSFLTGVYAKMMFISELIIAGLLVVVMLVVFVTVAGELIDKFNKRK